MEPNLTLHPRPKFERHRRHLDLVAASLVASLGFRRDVQVSAFNWIPSLSLDTVLTLRNERQRLSSLAWKPNCDQIKMGTGRTHDAVARGFIACASDVQLLAMKF